MIRGGCRRVAGHQKSPQCELSAWLPKSLDEKGAEASASSKARNRRETENMKVFDTELLTILTFSCSTFGVWHLDIYETVACHAISCSCQHGNWVQNVLEYLVERYDVIMSEVGYAHKVTLYDIESHVVTHMRNGPWIWIDSSAFPSDLLHGVWEDS